MSRLWSATTSLLVCLVLHEQTQGQGLEIDDQLSLNEIRGDLSILMTLDDADDGAKRGVYLKELMDDARRRKERCAKVVAMLNGRVRPERRDKTFSRWRNAIDSSFVDNILARRRRLNTTRELPRQLKRVTRLASLMNSRHVSNMDHLAEILVQHGTTLEQQQDAYFEETLAEMRIDGQVVGDEDGAEEGS